MIGTILLSSLIVMGLIVIEQQQQVKASDEIMTTFRNDVNTFKQTVDSTKFIPGNGVVKGLTEKLLQLGGAAYQIGGAAIPLLYSTEDYFINKVKQAGPQAFNQSEQDEIKSWINFAMEKRKENPDYSSNVLGSNFSSSSSPSPPSQPTITRSACPDGYHTSPVGTCEPTTGILR